MSDQTDDTSSEIVDEVDEIVLCGYADMLNDDERNLAFRQAIEYCVARLVETRNPNGQTRFNCCDIGAGSGLLSMMIARAFLSHNYRNFHVVSYECFKPMAICAKKVIIANNLSDFIEVVPINSRKVKISEMADRFDLLVAEQLDTELIGDFCLQVYRHAIENLCKPECLFVPLKARIYIEPVSSTFLANRTTIKDLIIHLGDKNILISCPQAVEGCDGLGDVDDLQLSMIKPTEDFIRVTDTQVAFEFDFSNIDSLQLLSEKAISFRLHDKIPDPVILMWWDVIMYEKVAGLQVGKKQSLDMQILSCAPTWARSTELLKRDEAVSTMYRRDVWREHWLQGAYRPAKIQEAASLEAGDYLIIRAFHDRCSMWFSIASSPEDRRPLAKPHCSCDVHWNLSRGDLSMINDRSLMTKLVQSALHDEEHITRGKLVIDGPSHLWFIEFSGDFGTDKIIMQGPYLSGLEPEKKMLENYQTKCEVSVIESFEIVFTQVEFKNLMRIRSKRYICEGFDLGIVDQFISGPRDVMKSELDYHYLWEYEAKRVDHRDFVAYSSKTDGHLEQDLLSADAISKRFNLGGPKTCPVGRALVFWLEVKLEGTDEIICCGPTSTRPDGYMNWYRYCQQGVYFMHESIGPELDPSKITLHFEENGVISVIREKLSQV